MIEFHPMVANEVARLQMDTLGCKSKGTVAQANFYRKKEELHRRVYLYERDFLRCLDEYIIYYNSQRPHIYNGYKTPDDAEKCSKNQYFQSICLEGRGFKLLLFHIIVFIFQI